MDDKDDGILNHCAVVSDTGPWYSHPATRKWAKQILHDTPPPPLRSKLREKWRDSIEIREGLIKQLVKEINEHQTQILRMQVTLSPIRLMPPEILGQIFLHARQADFEFVEGGSLSHPALGVCKLWRQVALDTPRLWGNFRMNNIVDKLAGLSRGFRMEKIQLWASRAKAVPWDIQTSNVCREEYWKVIFDHIDQWSTWCHTGHSPEVRRVLTRAGEMVKLRELTLKCGSETTVINLSDFSEGVSITFPVLKKLRLESGAVLKLPPIFAPRLTDLYLASPQSSHLEHAATAYPELTSLELLFIGPGSSESGGFACSEVFAKLETFRSESHGFSKPIAGLIPAVRNITSMTLSCLLPGITFHGKLTSLKMLRLEYIDRREGNDQIITKLLEETVPNLERLEIKDSDATAHILVLLARPSVCADLKQVYLERIQLERRALLEFGMHRSNKPRSKYWTPVGFKRCLVTLNQCRYANALDLPDVVDADWSVIGNLKSTRNVELKKRQPRHPH